MKKRIIAVIGVMVYSGVLCSLLALQLLMIDGAFPRLMANMAALLLTLPTLFVAYLYHKHGNSKEHVNADLENVAVTQESIPASMSLEEIRIHVYDLMRQKNLSNREIEVSWLIYRGYTNLQIAEELYISEATVKKHASHIYEKLEISGRKEFKQYLKAYIAAK